jgi:hypothetical protein
MCQRNSTYKASAEDPSTVAATTWSEFAPSSTLGIAAGSGMTAGSTGAAAPDSAPAWVSCCGGAGESVAGRAVVAPPRPVPPLPRPLPLPLGGAAFGGIV